MEQDFCRLASEAGVELIEQKSRFIARGRSVEDETEAIAFLASVRSEYPDATHHVYAYALSKDSFRQRYSDDGEPSGTAGLPVLNVLKQHDLSQSVIVVVRYFGGTLLGTGGLTRTYGRAAALLIQKAGVERLISCRQFGLTVSYGDFDPLSRMLTHLGAKVQNTRFGLDVDLVVCVPRGLEDEFYRQVTELTRGSALIESAGEGFIVQAIDPAAEPDS